MAIAAINIAIILDIIKEPSLPKSLFSLLRRRNVTAVNAITIVIDTDAVNHPYLSTVIIVVVMAPGPTKRGNARGTALNPITSLLSFNSQPLSSISKDKMRSNNPPAILKLSKVTLNILSIYWPRMANAINRLVAVMSVFLITLLTSSLERLEVNETSNGTKPIGSITMNRDIVDLIISSKDSVIDCISKAVIIIQSLIY